MLNLTRIHRDETDRLIADGIPFQSFQQSSEG